MDVSVMQICGPPGICTGWFKYLSKRFRVDKTRTQNMKAWWIPVSVWVECRHLNEETRKSLKSVNKTIFSFNALLSILQHMPEAAPFPLFSLTPLPQMHPSPLDRCYNAACPSVPFSFCTHLAGKRGLGRPDVCWTGSLRWQQLPAHHRGTEAGSKNISRQFNF